MSDPITNLINLANKIPSLAGPIDQFVKQAEALPAAALQDVSGLASGLESAGETLINSIQREVSSIGLDNDFKYFESLINHLIARAKSDADSAAITLGKDLKKFVSFADGQLSQLDSYRSAPTATSGHYASELAAICQQFHQVSASLAQQVGFTTPAAFDRALTTITNIAEEVPGDVAAHMESHLPLSSVQAVLDYIQSSDKAMLKAEEISPDNLRTVTQLLGEVVKVLDSAASSLDKEVSLKVSGFLQGGIGVVGGWAAGVAGKVGLDISAQQGIDIGVIPIDVLAPFFRGFSLFFGVLCQILNAIADWMEIDALPAAS